MIRCRTCIMPDTRPDVPFVDGICAACRTYASRPAIDWDARRQALLQLLERHDGRCIVPSSGGKDSHYQVLKLLELGARPLVVTATTCHLTPTGRANIDNLARYATTIEVTPNRSVRARLNRTGMDLVGDISWPEHVSIFTTPFRVAVEKGYKLLFYGENPQNQYGGPAGADEAMQLTRRWRSEFGGFLGLRPEDLIALDGITYADMVDYQMPPDTALDDVEAHFLGQYLPWDSHVNAEVARKGGMRWHLPCPASYWPFENVDNAQTGLHDHQMFRKYGFGRLAAQVSVDVRSGKLARETGMALVRERDGQFPERYAGVALNELMARIGLKLDRLVRMLNQHTNWELFSRGRDGQIILKEFAHADEAA